MDKLIVIVSDRREYYFEYFNESYHGEEIDDSVQICCATCWEDIENLDVDRTEILFYRCSDTKLKDRWYYKKYQRSIQNGGSQGESS